MPGSIKSAAAEVAAKRGSSNWAQDVELKIEKGQTVVVRFLDTVEEIERQWCYMHQLPPRGRAKYGEMVPCLDQAGDGAHQCPACEQELPRRVQGFVNLIWYDGPVYGKKKDDRGNERIDFKNQIGTDTVLAVWRRGITTLEELVSLAERWGGLMTRDADVTRNNADGFDVRYTISPHIDERGESKPGPLTDKTAQLAAKKPDLSERVKPMTVMQMQVALGGGNPYSAEQVAGAQSSNLEDAFNSIVTPSPFEKTGQ